MKMEEANTTVTEPTTFETETRFEEPPPNVKRPFYRRKPISGSEVYRGFTCNECSKFVRHRSAFERHMLTHSKERPFACTFCTKRYRRLDHLKNHIKTFHSGRIHVVLNLLPECFLHYNYYDVVDKILIIKCI